MEPPWRPSGSCHTAVEYLINAQFTSTYLNICFRLPKAADVSRQWDSELAKLADSLLISQISDRSGVSGADLSGNGSFSHPVITQMSPEKQSMLRNVLVQRPVVRIRAVRPETPNESRLLSNLSSMIQATSVKSPAPSSDVQQQQASPAAGIMN